MKSEKSKFWALICPRHAPLEKTSVIGLTGCMNSNPSAGLGPLVVYPQGVVCNPAVTPVMGPFGEDAATTMYSVSRQDDENVHPAKWVQARVSDGEGRKLSVIGDVACAEKFTD